ncbi:MAG: HypC/HybG/HupF family hydrogenase formation chaperone [Chloroflexi bacterium]|nr:HypC/HybG/HupF family hydrogenase formation chaperone [Chloroflexota bacterium]MBI4507851.1 HypC/HybG/HupF family hydrogenase formation chaperone [Chloroflexota bacterium]
MCVALPAKVVDVTESAAVVELLTGGRRQASRGLRPDARVGDFVLVDRGLIVEVVTPDEAAELLAFYRQLAATLEQEMSP